MVGRRVGGMIRDLCAKNQFAEVFMGSKPSHAMQSNRPESGGADRDMLREKSGLLERDKEKFAQEEQEKRAEGSKAKKNG